MNNKINLKTIKSLVQLLTSTPDLQSIQVGDLILTAKSKPTIQPAPVKQEEIPFSKSKEPTTWEAYQAQKEKFLKMGASS